MIRRIFFLIFIMLAIFSQVVFAMNMSCDFCCLGEMFDDEYKSTYQFKNIKLVDGDLEKGIGKVSSSYGNLYIHYNKKGFNKNRVLFGGINEINSVDLTEKFLPPFHRLYEIKNDTQRPIYFIEKGYAHIANSAIEVISCNEQGKWFSYFDSMENLQSYGHSFTDCNIMRELTIEKDYIIIKYLTYNHISVNGKFISKPIEYELVYKWDEAAKWFSISHRIVNENPSTQFIPIKCYSNGYSTTL